MDLPKRLAPQDSPGRNPREAPRAMEADENATPRRPVPARSASPQRKKVLGERNGAGSGSRGEGASAQPKVAPSPPSPASRSGAAYDPKTNWTTPRPEFLRYDPKRSAEILLRLDRERKVEEEISGVTSGTEISEEVSADSSARESDSDSDEEDEWEEVLPAQGGSRARRLFLLLVSAACLLCYVYCMNSAPFPATSEEPLGFVGWNGRMHGVGVHEVFSLGPVDMMGLEDEPEADMGQILDQDSEDGIRLHGPGGSPSNFMAVAMIGMADACPDVPFGEFSCQIGDENSENVDVLKEDSETGKLKSKAIVGGDVSGDSFGSTHSYDTSMEEDMLVLVHQEKGEDDSEHSMEKIMESGSLKVETDDKELLAALEYGNTAEAAKEVAHMVKKFWSAVEPHLLKMLAFLSLAGFVTAMLKYSQRSRNVNVPKSKRRPSAPPARVPTLAHHSIAQPPAFHSEQPVQRTIPKQETSSCLELPVQSLLPKQDLSVRLDGPSVGQRNHNQKIQQGDVMASIGRASDVMDHEDIDKSKPPVIQLLGEFSYLAIGTSRGRPVKDSNQHGVDTTVQESVKMQKESDKTQSPGVQAARKKESAAEEERIGATPTPLRRSSRLRKKVSP